MKKSAALFFLALLVSSPAFADIYKWTDKDGTLHLTDDMHKVPQEYRRSIEVIKTEPMGEAAPPPSGVSAPARPGIFDSPAQKEAPPAAAGDVQPAGPELFGDYPLDWWKNAFNQKNREIETLEKAIREKSEYVSLFDSGRRFGQTYDAEKTAQYKKFKDELPTDDARLGELKDELEELKRKARSFGVPKDVRGD